MRTHIIITNINEFRRRIISIIKSVKHMSLLINLHKRSHRFSKMEAIIE